MSDITRISELLVALYDKVERALRRAEYAEARAAALQGVTTYRGVVAYRVHSLCRDRNY